MIYLIIGIAAMAVLLDLRASLLVLRAPFCEWQKKAIQLAFIWMVPFIGALMATQVLSDNHTRYVRNEWPDPGEYIVYPPNDCGQVHSHSYSDSCE